MAKSKAKLDAYKKIKDEDEAIPVLDQVDKSQFVADYVNSYQVPADKSIKDQKISQLKVDVNSKQYQQILKSIPTYEESVENEITQVKPIVEPTNDLADLIKHLQAPSIEIDTFSGNCIDYPYFMAAFTEVVESKISNPRGRLTRLLKFLKDEAKDLVQSCVYLPAEEGYKKARFLLEKRYGNQYQIMSEYRKELKSWPKLKSHDAKGFRQFYCFLLKYKSTMLSLKNSH